MSLFEIQSVAKGKKEKKFYFHSSVQWDDRGSNDIKNCSLSHSGRGGEGGEEDEEKAHQFSMPLKSFQERI